MKNNDWKDRLGIVFSTNLDFEYEMDGLIEEETLPKQQQKLRVRIEKQGRGGKVVTVVDGFVGCTDDLKDLGRMLKTKCGVGGSVKAGVVVIQGSLRDRVVALLKSEGYSQTR